MISCLTFFIPCSSPQVLRFWCIWDDRQSMYGDRRPYVLHYFLEDDTVEILEINENNSGECVRDVSKSVAQIHLRREGWLLPMKYAQSAS